MITWDGRVHVGLVRRQLIGRLLLWSAVVCNRPAYTLIPGEDVRVSYTLFKLRRSYLEFDHLRVLTCGSAAPSAVWSWTSGGSAGRGERWGAAMSWFCSRGPRRRSDRGCRCEPPSLVHTLNGSKNTQKQGQEDAELLYV